MGSLGRFGALKRVSWRPSGVSWGFLGVSWVALRLSWGTSEPKWLEKSLKYRLADFILKAGFQLGASVLHGRGGVFEGSGGS